MATRYKIAWPNVALVAWVFFWAWMAGPPPRINGDLCLLLAYCGPVAFIAWFIHHVRRAAVPSEGTDHE